MTNEEAIVALTRLREDCLKTVNKFESTFNYESSQRKMIELYDMCIYALGITNKDE